MDQPGAERLFGGEHLEDVTFEPEAGSEAEQEAEFVRLFGEPSSKSFQKQKIPPKRSREEVSEPPPRKSPVPHEFGFGSQETLPVSNQPPPARRPITQVHQPITAVPTQPQVPQIPLPQVEDILKQFDDDYNYLLLRGEVIDVKRSPFQWAYLLRTYGTKTNRLANKEEVETRRAQNLKILTSLYQTLSIRFDFLFKQAPPKENWPTVWEEIDLLTAIFLDNDFKIPVNREVEDIENRLLSLYGLPTKPKASAPPPPAQTVTAPPQSLFQNVIRSVLGTGGQNPPTPAQQPQNPPPPQQQPTATRRAIPPLQRGVAPVPVLTPATPGQGRRTDEADPLSTLDDPCFTMLQNALYTGMSFFIFFRESFFVKRIF